MSNIASRFFSRGKENCPLMRIVRHNAYINQQKRKARWLSILGFVILSSSMFIAMMPNMWVFAYITMIGGFIMFNIGMQGVGKWTRNPRNDQMIDSRMRGLNDQYAVIHYPEINGKRNIEHVAVYPGGVMLLNAREIDGNIIERGPSWRKSGGMFRRMMSFSGPQLGNPSLENDRNLENMEKWLAEQGIDTHLDAATVFLHPRADLHIEDPDFPVLHGEELDDFFRDQEPDPDFTNDQRNALISALSAGEGVEADAKISASRRPRPVRRVAAPKTKATTVQGKGSSAGGR